MDKLQKTKWQHVCTTLLLIYLAVGLPVLHSAAHEVFHPHLAHCEHGHEDKSHHDHSLFVESFICHHECPICEFWATNHLIKSDIKQNNLFTVAREIFLPKVQVNFRYVLQVLQSCRAPPPVA